jgi:uncharacterized membrane protein
MILHRARVIPERSSREATVATRPRFEAIDLLRGAAIVLMTLDHTRDFFSAGRVNPNDLTSNFGDPALALTRLVTHVCAPTFMFLAGVSAYLAKVYGRALPDLPTYLLRRGLSLVALEIFLVKFLVSFYFDPRLIVASELWAIGWSMVVLSVLVRFPARVAGCIGLAMIFGHDALDGLRASDAPWWVEALWHLLHQPGTLALPGGFELIVEYSLIPWVGIMALGYATGPLWKLSPPRRRRILLAAGAGFLAIFLVLRATGLYGDPRPWDPAQAGRAARSLSFLNCTKYPPSLQFLLMTLGPSLVALALADACPGLMRRPLVTLGRVPLFYFLIHWPVLHLLALGLSMGKGEDYRWLIARTPFLPPDGYGYGLPTVYLVCAGVLVLLYFPSLWFAGIKARRRSGWSTYL